MDQYKQPIDVIKDMVSDQETDVDRRNSYINTRYEAIYGDGLMARVDIRSGNDRTNYNYLPRVVDIHSAQVTGRMPQITSTYDKEDLSVYELGVTDQSAADTEKEKARLRNGRVASDAETRNTAIRNIMRDNKFDVLASRGARIGSWAGITVFKGWPDKKTKRYNFSLLETPQNFVRVWSNSNFREADADVYAYQISKSKAMREYGRYLKDGETFDYCSKDNIWFKRTTTAQDLETENAKNYTWVVETTGYIPGYTPKDGKLVECDHGKEERANVLTVGGVVVQVLDKGLPVYYVIDNEDVAGEPWGKSDISNELMDVNATMIETMSDWRTASFKLTFPKLKGIGFDSVSMPSIASRQSEIIPMGEGQDLVPVNMQNTLSEFPRQMEELWNSFTKLAKVSRVMIEDPTVNPASNQGLMTTMKPLIDVAEDKQKRWGAALVDMFTDALNAVADFDPALKEAINEHNWTLQVKWPSVLRREDAAYQQMYLNRWNSGTISPESYLEAMGDDAGEEIERIRDALTDPVRAGMMARMLQPVANAAINKMLGIPPWGYVVPKVQLRGDLAPSEVGNIAHNYQWDQGPYGDTVGPQGMEGTMANQDTINAGMFNGEPRNGGTPAYMHPGQQPTGDFNASAPNPTLTPDQNTGQGVISQPGSGATGVSPQGAINQVNQHQGK